MVCSLRNVLEYTSDCLDLFEIVFHDVGNCIYKYKLRYYNERAGSLMSGSLSGAKFVHI